MIRALRPLARRLLPAVVALACAPLWADREDVKALQPSISLQWQLIKDDRQHNIQVYSKLEDDRRIRSMKGEGELPASVGDMVETLFDFNRYPEWFWRLKEIRLLKQVSPLEAWVYVSFSPPMGLPDRDTVLHYTAEYERGGTRATVHAVGVPDYLPPQAGKVRMPYATLDAWIAARDEGKVWFRGEVVMDPGGQLPVWASNLVQRQGPYYTMLNLIKVLEHKTAPADEAMLPSRPGRS